MTSKHFLFITLISIILIYTGLVFSPLQADVEPPESADILFEKVQHIKNEESKNNKKVFIVVLTGYSSSHDETDDTPYITASGALVRPGIAATNFLPIGTKIKIPSIFGDKIFVIQDRMNPRYYYRVDIWFPSKEEALNFGIHYNVPIEIVD